MERIPVARKRLPHPFRVGYRIGPTGTALKGICQDENSILKYGASPFVETQVTRLE
jgi:hypothetical protein